MSSIKRFSKAKVGDTVYCIAINHACRNDTSIQEYTVVKRYGCFTNKLTLVLENPTSSNPFYIDLFTKYDNGCHFTGRMYCFTGKTKAEEYLDRMKHF